MKLATATPDFAALDEALAEVNSTAIQELYNLNDRLVAEEAELVQKTAAGDVQAAAQLTVNRVRVREVLPGELEKLKARRWPVTKQLWDATNQTLSQCSGFGAEVVKQIGDEVNAAVAPALDGFGIKADVSGFANRTPRGRRAETLVATLNRIEADLPRHSGFQSFNPNGVDIEGQLEQFKLCATSKANRLIAAWQEFQAE